MKNNIDVYTLIYIQNREENIDC